MSSTCKQLLAAAIILAAGTAAANAAGAAGANDKDAAAASKALGGTNATYARIAALINPNGSVVRSKGVAAVTHPRTGEYCIKPNFAVSVPRLVPSVSVDWSNSIGNGNFVQYRSSGIGCPAGYIDVLTFSFNPANGTFAQANNTAFTIVVP